MIIQTEFPPYYGHGMIFWFSHRGIVGIMSYTYIYANAPRPGTTIIGCTN